MGTADKVDIEGDKFTPQEISAMIISIKRKLKISSNSDMFRRMKTWNVSCPNILEVKKLHGKISN